MSTLSEIQRLVDELCSPRDHFEPLYVTTASRHKKWNGVHRSEVPALLDHLRNMIPPGSKNGETKGHPEYESRPPLNLEALHRYTMISNEIRDYLRQAHAPMLGTPVDGMRQLVALVALGQLDPDEVLTSVRQWHAWAAVLAAERSRVWRPHVRCPMDYCGLRGTLWVNLGRRAAYCANCNAQWDSDSIELLAHAVRSAA